MSRPKTVVVAIRLDQEAHEIVKALVGELRASDDIANYSISSVIRALVHRYGPVFAKERGLKLPRASKG